MFRFEDGNGDDFMDQDTAVMQAMELTDRGLFDPEENRDEDVLALFRR